MTARLDDRRLTLPGGAAFAPDEQLLLADRFMVSTIAFYLHTDLALTNRRFYSVRPNLLLGLGPVGTARSNYPIENIAGVSASTRFDVLGVAFGLVLMVFGTGAMQAQGGATLGWLLLVVGLATIIGAPKQTIEIMNSGGGVIRMPVSVFERGRTIDFANRVSQAVARTAHGTRQPPHDTRSSGAGAADAMRELQLLRDQGLITASEYATKRSEILARL